LRRPATEAPVRARRGALLRRRRRRQRAGRLHAVELLLAGASPPEAVMFELKPITRDAVPRALEKAERYRLLNEPSDAESICLDVLGVDPDNQKALVMMLLAVTDQFEGFAVDAHRAQDVLQRLKGDYERAYYAGIISERRAKAQLKKGGPGSGYVAYDGFRE